MLADGSNAAEVWSVGISIVALLFACASFLRGHELNEYTHRAANRLEFHKLILEVDKLLIDHPELSAIYDIGPSQGKTSPQRAYAYYLLNMLDVVNAYYCDAPLALQNKDINEWQAWSRYLALVLKSSSEVQDILKEDEAREDHVYSDKFRAYCKEIIEGRQSRLQPFTFQGLAGLDSLENRR